MKIYILHGWTYNLDKWDDFVTELKKLKIDPVMLKVPGLTTSSEKVWDIESYSNWLDEQLKKEKHPIVLGQSNGGRIALYYAQTHPNKLGKLILIDSAGLAHVQITKKIKLKIIYIISKLGKPLAKFPLVSKISYKIIGAQDYYNAPPNMRQTMQNMLAADKQIKFQEITVPTTLIWGENDAITPLKDGKEMAKQINNSPLHIIQDARHSPQATDAEEVAKIVAKAMR